MRRALCAIAMLVAGAGCMAPPPLDPEMQALLELESAQRPLQACVDQAMRNRPDFSGSLPGIIVDAGMAPEMQALRKKYLTGDLDLTDQPHDIQIEATRSALLALGRYGGGAAAPGETARVRRMMAMVETTTTIAAATGIDCAPSETLIRLMNKAENEYL